MDQYITLHARPTDVTSADRRTMTRMIPYLDNPYPGEGPAEYVLYDGEPVTHERFAEMVDQARLEEFASKVGRAAA